jgi:hypothetical protein
VAKVALILGVIGMVLGGGVFLVSLMLPMMSSHTSWDEAMFGIIPGALVLMGSSVLAIVGVVLLIMKRKKARAAA